MTYRLSGRTAARNTGSRASAEAAVIFYAAFDSQNRWFEEVYTEKRVFARVATGLRSIIRFSRLSRHSAFVRRLIGVSFLLRGIRDCAQSIGWDHLFFLFCSTIFCRGRYNGTIARIRIRRRIVEEFFEDRQSKKKTDNCVFDFENRFESRQARRDRGGEKRKCEKKFKAERKIKLGDQEGTKGVRLQVRLIKANNARQIPFASTSEGDFSKKMKNS